MKNWIFILVMTGMPLFLFSQGKNSINHFFQKYKHHNEAEHFKIGGLLLDLAVGFTDDDEAKGILKKLKRIRLLTIENDNPVSKEDYKQLIRHMDAEKYAPLIKVKNGNENVNIYVQEKHDFISEIIVLINSDDDFLLLQLDGKFKFEDLNDLDLDIKGGEHLDKLPDDREKLEKA